MDADKQFVLAIFNELFDKNFQQYQAALNRPVNKDKDSYAIARNALSKLTETDRADVLNFFKIVIADSASVILGTLDGVHYPDDIDGEFLVSYEGESIHGDLMDLFIEKAQEEGVYG